MWSFSSLMFTANHLKLSLFFRACYNLSLLFLLCWLGPGVVMDNKTTGSDRVSRLPVFRLWSISSRSFCPLQIYSCCVPWETALPWKKQFLASETLQRFSTKRWITWARNVGETRAYMLLILQKQVWNLFLLFGLKPARFDLVLFLYFSCALRPRMYTYIKTIEWSH